MEEMDENRRATFLTPDTEKNEAPVQDMPKDLCWMLSFEAQAMFDDIHIMFEDDPPVDEKAGGDQQEFHRHETKRNRRKSRRSMDFTPNKPKLLEARDSQSPHGQDIQSQQLDKPSDSSHSLPQENGELHDLAEIASSKPKRRGRKRKSADFDIIHNVEVTISPEIQLEGLAEMQTLPGTRKSRRIRRQSLELCTKQSLRRNTLYLNTMKNLNEEEGLDDSEEPESPLPESPVTPSLPDVRASPLLGETGSTEGVSDSCGSDKGNNKKLKDDCDTVEVCIKGGEQELNNEHETESVNAVLVEKKTKGKAGRKSKKKTEKTTEESTVKKGTASATTKGRKRKKKNDEPDIEDIYKNRLWRTQMPVPEKPWETIYEEPHINKSGEAQFLSVKRAKRLLSYEDFYTQQKLKRRRQKASKLGYKPLTKKKQELAEIKVAEKLALLDDLMENINVNFNLELSSLASNSVDSGKKVSIISNQNSCAETEEKYFTPMKLEEHDAVDNTSSNRNCKSSLFDSICKKNIEVIPEEEVFVTPQQKMYLAKVNNNSETKTLSPLPFIPEEI